MTIFPVVLCVILNIYYFHRFDLANKASRTIHGETMQVRLGKVVYAVAVLCIVHGRAYIDRREKFKSGF
jgi:hypothetical protein